MPSRTKITRPPSSSTRLSKAHIKEHPAWFHRFEAVWTRTVLLLDSEGKERVRLEGYLANDDFIAALESGLGRIAFAHKKHADAERWYNDVVARFGNSHSGRKQCISATRRPTTMLCWTKSPRNFDARTHQRVGKVIPWLPKESQKEVA
jgi:hypothetical protein